MIEIYNVFSGMIQTDKYSISVNNRNLRIKLCFISCSSRAAALIFNEDHWFPKVIVSLSKGRYVDDIFGDAESMDKEVITQICQLCLADGFPLKKWNNDCQALLNHLSLSNDNVSN